jgi:hypothetical protein
MTRDLPSWLNEDDDAPERPAPRRRWLLVSAAVLPWLVLVGLLVTGTLSPDTTPAADVAVATDAAPGAENGAIPGAGGAQRQEPEPRRTRRSPPEGGSTAPTGTDDGAGPGVGLGSPAMDPAPAGALAVAIARSWLTDVGPRLQIGGIDVRPDRYLEQAVVESMTVHGDVAVVGLLAVVLERDGDHYGDVAVHRVAVPIHLAPSGPRPAGRPWWLPDPELQLEPPPLEVLEDPDVGMAAAELLAARGYDELEVVRLASPGEGWLVADITARLEGGRRVDGPVWLRATSAGLELVGLPEQPNAPPQDAADPSGDAPDLRDEHPDLRDEHVEENS